jgi:O-antigen ligase
MRFEPIRNRENFLPILLLCVSASTLTGALMALGQSWLVVAAPVFVGMGLLILARPELATLIYIFAMYLNLPALASRFHGVPQPVASATVLILVIPLASYLVLHRMPVVVTRPLPLMIAYLPAMAASAMFQQTVTASFPWIMNYATEGLLLYLLIVNVIRTPETLRRVIWALILAGAVMGGLSLCQEVTGGYDNMFGGLAQMSSGIIELGEDLEGKLTRGRMAGPIGETNRYAQVLVVLLPLALFRTLSERRRGLKLLAAGSALLILSGILLSFSRGAAVVVAGLLVLMVIWRAVKLYQAALTIAVLIATVPLAAPDFITRLDSLRGVEGVVSEEGEDPDGAMRGRLTSNIAALQAFVEHPLLGVGPGQYYEQYSQRYANQLGLRYFTTTRRAHNLYLEMAADLGLIGLGLFMAMVIITLLQLRRARVYWLPRNPEYANLATALLLSMLGYLGTAVFLHLSYQRYFWLLLALANAGVYVLKAVSYQPSAVSFACSDATAQLETYICDAQLA